MGIPSPLSFPPTALRNVAAGLVVGNPIGSGGTRGKALTAAELKAIVEASGISYLPLSGGTMTGALSLGSNQLTCGAITASGRISGGASGLTIGQDATYNWFNDTDGSWYCNSTGNGIRFRYQGSNKAVITTSGVYFDSGVAGAAGTGPLVLTTGITGSANTVYQRNALNAQCFLVNKTYTSDASQEALMLDAGKQISGKLGLYSYRGSSGGSNYPIQIGMLAADGSTFSGLSVATNGAVTANGTLNYSDGTIDARTSMNHALTLRATGAATAIRVLDGSGVTKWSVDSTGSMTIGTLGYLSFPHSTTVGDPNQIITGGGTGLGLRTSGSLSVATGGSGATFTVDATGKVTSTSQMTHVPPTSTITLATNGQFSIEMTSNTAGNLVYRGSDGTTRRMALAFS